MESSLSPERKLAIAISERCRRFGFYELVATLERLIPRAQVGSEFGDGSAIEFRSTKTLGYTAADVVDVQFSGLEDKELRATVWTSFFGLIGATGPLANYFTEAALHSDDDEQSLSRLLDIFHQRAIELLYLAWKKYNFSSGFDLGGRSSLSRRLLSMTGIDAWAVRKTSALPPFVTLSMADCRRGQPSTIDLRTMKALLVRLLPDLPIAEVEGRKREVQRTRGELAVLGECNNVLGEDLVYGSSYQDEMGLLRVTIGPVSYSGYERLIPGGSEFALLRKTIDALTSSRVDVELEVVIAADEVPSCELGSAIGTVLGVDSRISADAGEELRVRVPLINGNSCPELQFVGYW